MPRGGLAPRDGATRYHREVPTAQAPSRRGRGDPSPCEEWAPEISGPHPPQGESAPKVKQKGSAGSSSPMVRISCEGNLGPCGPKSIVKLKGHIIVPVGTIAWPHM
eukprot:Gb_18315 [translate_table: standard]